MRVFLSILLVASFGCGGLDPLGPRFEQRLTRFSACGDVFFFAVDADNELMVTFSTLGLVAAADESGTEAETVFHFPADDVDLMVEQGSRISDSTCTDLIVNGGPRVQRKWTAVSGTGTVRIRPGEGSIGGHGDLVLEDVVFTSAGEHDVTVEDLEWHDVAVGWFPGE